MELLKVQTINGEYETNVYNIKDFPYHTLYNLPTVRKKQQSYYNVACAFDIETTTIDGIKDDKGNYITNPYGFMYQWQFCINNYVVFGRRWEEFQIFIKKLCDTLDLSDNNILVVYVHNLSFEFQFIKDFFEITSIFAREPRKIMKFNTSNGIEFRCSYFLSNMSLAKFCENTKNVTHYKLVDEYDYNKIRTYKTQLTEKEKQYCYNDVFGLCECINELLKDDNICTIPLTNTGYVRREYREVMTTKKNRNNLLNTQLSKEQYQLLKQAFRGGNTHANRYMAGYTINNVHSYDISSSYPACMLLDDYPMGKFMECKINNQMKLNYFLKTYCMVLEVAFKNISCKNNIAIPYIDISHCRNIIKSINDNGRVLQADYLTITLTNIDLDIIRNQYLYDDFIILRSFYTTKGKLPVEFRKKTLDFFYRKSLLKGVKNKEYEYMKSKNRLNSSFGMMVTDMAHDEITYNQDTFEWDRIVEDVETALKKYYGNRNNFLAYQWGVFVTANARKRLQNMIDIVGLDIVYIDTDSIKFQNIEHLKEFENLNDTIKKQCEQSDIPAYVDVKEKRVYMGVWDYEGVYDRFKTLGAKKYCFEKDNKFNVTVAGMNKKKGAVAVGSCDNFLIGKTFNNVGRSTSWYNDEKPHYIEVNGDKFLTASNIGILETTYTLGVTNEYFEIIGKNIIDTI